MSESVTVTIGDAEILLTLPASFTIRHEIALAAGQSWQRATVAALGVCWPERDPATGARDRRRPKVAYSTTHSPLVFGGTFLDALIEAGVKPADVWPAAWKAWAMVSDGILVEDEVEAAAAGFHEARPEP